MNAIYNIYNTLSLRKIKNILKESNSVNGLAN